MKTERVNSLLAEIVSSQGFINIDQNDVDSFKANVGDIDAEKVSGKIEEIGVMLDNAISSIIERNDSKQVKGLLFVIRLPQDNCFMENINDIHEVIDKLGEELECKWGISTMNKKKNDQFELIVVIGF
mgnify:FL=1